MDTMDYVEYAAAAVCRDFLVTPLEARVLQVDVLKFSGYIHNHKILPIRNHGLRVS